MRILFFDCGMGAAGDMVMGALLSLIPDKDAFIKEINSIGIPDTAVSYENDSKCGISGIHISVHIAGKEEECDETDLHHSREHVHHHAGLDDIRKIIDNLKVSDKVKKEVTNIYMMIAQAESKVHGKDVGEIHFHEVGMMDAIADITGCAMLLEKLSVQSIYISPVNTGFGKVRCAHGILPVPAPATAELLKGVPCYAGRIEGELCTPTGAALLSYYGTAYSQMPPMCIMETGYGCGKKDFEAANVVRAVLGETDSEPDSIIELACNIDDMTGEELGYVTKLLLNEGALDVYTAAISMKKNRPGILLSVICKRPLREKMTELIFKHTTTIGLREYICNRTILNRREKEIDTGIGKVRIKEAYGNGIYKMKPEYEDVRKIADATGKSVREIHEIILKEQKWQGNNK